ncbi:beta-ketoacyl-ACP synthase II [Ruminococcus sp. YE282]|uniref:beta-ketoacyl-ACP synthase II n=1 Tax=Ruminococcus sp. YE282 TaxID=3158780 RepID=UPI00087F4317|nr:beta-ketoacyl-ACP synthase II [Ruminococcus bromii]MEE3498358.1 beta-ketoacyl-ACP synthase II [Ruminococcus bromii]SCY59645.1 3-oxoacyl-[acyl-carrier-protein] synthase II [Ruminococcus bromii]
MEKIVVTGMGAVTPVGIGVDTYWKNITSGVSGIDTIKSFDTSDLAVQIAGEIKNFVPSDYLPKDLIRKTDPFMQYAYIAAEEAIKQSNIDIVPERTGITMGTAMSGIATTAFTQDALSGASHKKVGPRFIPKILGNIAAANISINYNIQGPSFTISTACSSGGDAINMACMCIQSGKADVMIAVGAESVLCPLVIYSLANAKALSRRNDTPKTASRPFDITRDGFVIGEGGGALVIETEAHALARGAKIYAEIKSCGNTSDAYHVTAPHPEGRGAIACMKQALSDAKLSPSDIGYINAHGTATNKGDAVEIEAIKNIFTDKLPFVSSTKGATGHMMGAGGITETIACIKTIETGIIPPTINLNEVDPECSGVDLVANTAKKAEINYAMSNAFGFGGQNSSVIVGKY